MGLLDFLFGNKKEKERIERERQEEQDHQRKAEEARIAREREARLVENRRKEAERQARLMAQAEKQRLEILAAELSKDFGSPAYKYKEDRFSKMIRKTSFNPFNMTCDPAANKNLQFGDMVSIFKNELNSNLSNAKHYGMPLKEALKGYVFNMIESYYNNAGYVPKAAADIIIEQIYAALQQTPYSNCIESEERLKYEMYWCFTHN